MNSNKHNTIKNILIVSIVVLLFIALGIVSYIALFGHNAPRPDGTYASEDEEVQKNDNVISIPGYEGINLAANTKKQNVSLHNPAQNDCYFVITLELEDGTVLWESNYIKPGRVSDPIVLRKELEPGTYPAKLRYSCFKMDKKTPLNGAETKLNLRVK